MSQSWMLPVLLVVPLLGALVLMLLKSAPVRTVKLTALLFSLIPVVLVALLWIEHRNWQTTGQGWVAMGQAVPPTEAFFSSTFSFEWISAFGVHFALGLDGFSLVMIALIAILVPIVLGASWEEKLPEGRTIGGYFALILVLEFAMIGVFAATDVFLFYVMFEVMLIPMYFLIGAFGGPRRAYAATKFFLYSLLGGLLMLASLIGLFVASGKVLGQGTFDWATLRTIAADIPESTQLWIFAGFAIAFAIKAPLVPLHTWLPDAGAEAPVGAGTLLVGVLDKVGTFGFLRICIPLLPAATAKLSWLLITLAVIGIIYGAIVAAGQSDIKRFVTYTSIAHFGFIVLGVFAFTVQSTAGAVLYMVNHGIATALVFLLVGMLVARGGTRQISAYGGVWKVAPIMGGLFLLGSLATIAVPGTNSFISEFMVLIGSFGPHPVWTIIATTGIVFAAVYMLWVFQRMMTGPIRGEGVLDIGGPEGPGPQDVDAPGTTKVQGVHTAIRRKFGDLKPREIAVLSPLVILIVLLGLFPQPVLDVINPTAVTTVISVGDPSGTVLGSEAVLQVEEGGN